MSSLDLLKTFDADRMSFEDMVSLSSYGRRVQEEFEILNVEVPEWLPVSLKSIRRAIRDRVRDKLEKKRRALKAEIEVLKPAEVRRTEKEEELKKLDEALKEE
jgi:predicted nuclease with RNAse H fold